jgi:hypothetical protein
MTLVIITATIAIITATFLSGYALGVKNSDKFYLRTVSNEETPIYNQLKADYPDVHASLTTTIKVQ